MQAATVSRWLLNSKGVSVQEEWLEACLRWIADEEGRSVPQHRLQEMVYEQWLHTDLKDVATSGCIPQVVSQQQHGQINGRFIFQVDSVIDVGKPAYSQLQSLKGQSLDSVEGQDNKKFFEFKPTRLLLLTISDGVGELQAMEYQPIPQLSADLLPGTKIIIEGAVPFHLGVLLLSVPHVQVLGGRVEQLVEMNQPQRLLARILNREELANDDGSHSQTVPSRSAAIDSGPRPSTLQYTSSQDSSQARRVNGANLASGGQVSSSRVEAGCDGGSGFEGDIDINDLEEFLHEAEQENEEMLFEDDSIKMEEIDPGGGDVPTSEEQITENHSTPVHPLNVPDPSHVSRVQRSEHQSSHQEDDSCTISQHFGTKSSKLSLKQRSSKSRTCPAPQPSSTPPVASVRPFHHQEPTHEGSPCAGSRYEPVVLESLSELTTETSWKLHPMVKVKAHFVKVCQKLSHDSGEWMTVVVIGDEFGTELQVHICNEILEPLIGFSAVEFRDRINPNKSDLKVRAKASRGFAYCQSAIASLNCFMVLEKSPSYTLPFIVKLLDS